MSNDFLQDQELVEAFLVESTELLQAMDQDMVALETSPSDGDLLNRIFRAMHTIKGTAGFLGLEAVVKLSHRSEDVLNGLRRGDLKVSRRVMDVLLSARDQLGKMLVDLGNQEFGEYALDDLLHELESVQQVQNPPRPLGEMLVADKVLRPETLESALAEQAKMVEPKKIGALLVEKGAVSPAQVGDALVRQKSATESASDASTMRVDVRKLDELINLVGELVLERNRLVRLNHDFAARNLDAESFQAALGQSASRVSFVTEELQIASLKTRMVPMESVFRRFPRLVRDVSRSLQKEVNLVLVGQETEIDKTMAELIVDPLVHLVRNSLDHGLENASDREHCGKTREGTIRLEASQEGDQIVVAVCDDGAGIDPEKILAKAMERNFVSPDRARTLSKRDILDFIFLPGFSTAKIVNDLSGRGVGMDVVRSNLRKLNGSVELDSQVGKGTSIRLRLPLTLAILPVLLIEASEEIYALPLRAVIETLRITAESVHQVEGCEVLHLREETVPLVRLAKLFCLPAAATEARKVVILGIGGQKIALAVDKFIGQESTVIKPLGVYLHGSPQLAGATISGDGKVRFVIDPAGLLAAVFGGVDESARVPA